MKNILVIIFVMLFYALVKSEDTIKYKNNQIGILYGLFTFNSIFTGYRLSGVDMPYDYIINKDNYNRNTKEIPPLFGAINFTYKRFIKNKFVPNINIVYSQINSTFINTTNNSANFKTKDYTVTIMPGFEYHFIYEKRYSKYIQVFNLDYMLIIKKYM